MPSYERFYDPKVLASASAASSCSARLVVEGYHHRHAPEPATTASRSSSRSTASTRRATTSATSTGRSSAASDRFDLKRYEEETNLRGHVLLDCSESMRYSSGAGMSKYD